MKNERVEGVNLRAWMINGRKSDRETAERKKKMGMNMERKNFGECTSSSEVERSDIKIGYGGRSKEKEIKINKAKKKKIRNGANEG